MNSLYFEQAFNEQIRICLKLDGLFTQVEQGLQRAEGFGNRLALESVLNIVTLLDRPDFKSKMIKELGRLSLSFQRLIHSDRVDQPALQTILSQLQHLTEKFQLIEGKLAQNLRDNDFLTVIRLHQSIIGGVCLSETPAYRLWLNQGCHEQHEDLQAFLTQLEVMQQSVRLLLKLVRESAVPQSRIAEHGFYQTSLDAQQPLQLLRIHLPKQTRFFPETSIGRHGVSIRFYPLNTRDKRRHQTDQDIAFKLTICAL